MKKGRGNLQLWGTVLGLVWRLLLADHADVPHADAAVVAGGCQYGGILGMPLQPNDVAAVTLQRVQRLVEVAHVPHGDCLVCRASGKYSFELRVEGNAIDGVMVGLLSVESCRVRG